MQRSPILESPRDVHLVLLWQLHLIVPHSVHSLIIPQFFQFQEVDRSHHQSTEFQTVKDLRNHLDLQHCLILPVSKRRPEREN